MLQCFNLLEHDLYFLFFFITIMELHWFERGFGLSHEYLHNIYFFLSSALRRVVDCVSDVLSYLSHQYLYNFCFVFFSLSSASWSAVDCERRFKLLEHDVYNVLHRWVLSQAAVFWLQGKHQQHFCERTFSDCEFEMWNRLDDFFKMLLILFGNVIHIHMYDFQHLCVLVSSKYKFKKVKLLNCFTFWFNERK